MGSDPIPVQNSSVTIGLLVPDNSYTGVIGAAELAIQEANERGGFKGTPFKLVVRTTEGPWGAGSKESVALVYENDVRAIVGSLDGRNAHLAEQVAAKSHLVYLETRATDPTLSQAYVPWFIRNVPNDNQQAQAIFKLIGAGNSGKTALLSSEQYDTRHAVKSLTEYAASKGGTSPLILNVNPDKTNNKLIIDKLIKEKTDHLVVPFCTENSLEIIAGLLAYKKDLRIYGTLAFLTELKHQGTDLNSLEGMILVYTYEGSVDQSHMQSMEISTAYTLDGISLIMEAILNAGLERESIRDYIVQSNHSDGVTGSFHFDDLGNRIGDIQFVQVLNNKIVLLNNK